MLLSQRCHFPKEKMHKALDRKIFKMSTMQPKLFEAASLRLKFEERRSAEPCPSEYTSEQDDLQFSTNLADSNFLQSPALNVSFSPSNTTETPFPFTCNHTTEVQPILQSVPQVKPAVSEILSQHSSSLVNNVDNQCQITAEKSPHYCKTLSNCTDALPNLHNTKLFLDLQKDSIHKPILEDRSNVTTTSTTAPVLTTSTTENPESPFNEFYDLGNLQHSENLVIPTLRHSEEKKFTNSGHVDDFSAADYTTNTEEARNKVNQGTKFRSFLRKGARNRRSKIIKEPQKTYQYYSNAVAKTFSTADSIADGTFQTNDNSKRSTLCSLKSPCQKEEEKNILDAMCHLTNETFLQWEKIDTKASILNTNASLESCDKHEKGEPTFGNTMLRILTSVDKRTYYVVDVLYVDTQLNSTRDLEILRVQAQAKMALVDEQLTRLKEFQSTLESKKENFLKEKQIFLLEQERQRIEFHAEREEMLSDIEKKRDFLKKEKNKIFTQIESFEILIKEKSLLESQIQKLSREMKEQEEDFRNRETRYRNIIDRLNCKVRMLESKVRVLQEATEKSTKLHRESQISPGFKPNKGFKEKDVSVVTSWNRKDARKETMRKEAHLPYRLSRSTPIPSTTTHPETESDIVSTVSRHSTGHHSETSELKGQENREAIKGRLSNFRRLLEFDLKEKWSSFDEALALLGKPLALTLREPPITKTNGRQDFVYNDGHTEIVFSNGIRKVTLLNGWVFTFFTNGDIRGVNAKGILYYYYYNDSIYSITEADGTLFNYFPDHQLDCIYPDQTIQVRYPNKILKQIDAKGVEYIEKY